MNDTTITVASVINASVEKVWDYWTSPAHIMQWNNASDDWHTPYAENDVRKGGKFLSRMEAKDGSMGFDFTGVYGAVEKFKLITYIIDDGRKVTVHFLPEAGKTKVTETFDAEKVNGMDMQKAGWQAILDNFKQYTENN